MQKRIKETIVSFLNSNRPGKLLDIPAGNGWLKDELKGSGWEYHASDLYTNPELQNFKTADLNQPLPYDDHAFDYITCPEGLEHIENYHLVLREFHRILKPEGKVIVSTPNPLNIKSRRRYYREGTFYGFPHLVRMPKEGDHLHMSPINLSFLVTFAKKYGLSLNEVHEIPIKNSNWRYLFHCLFLKLRNAIRYSRKDRATKQFMKQLVSLNVLLNDGIVVSFQKDHITSAASAANSERSVLSK